MQKIKKYAIAAGIVVAVLFVVRKIKTTMFMDMDAKMKSIGLPVIVIVVANYMIKKEEYSMPLTIGGLITLLVAVLDMSDSKKFKVEDLGLAGDLMTTEFGSMDELNNYIQANLPMQGDDDEEVGYIEVEPMQANQNSEMYGEMKIDDLNGDLNGNNFLVVE
jgi:hypothetical protein